MMSLSDREYKAFVIGDVFQVSTGSLLPKGELKNGQIPRITASEANNGVIGTFAHSAHKNYRSLTNFISVSFLGGVFYHPYTASLDMKIHAVQVPELELSKPLGTFLVSVLKQTVSSFSYGDQLSSTDLPKKKILLPVDSSGSPDWQFMTEYMKAHEQKLIGRYEKYVQQIQLTERERVDSFAWGEFAITDIFNIKAGKRLTKADMQFGRQPFIGATDNNNGITNFVSNTNASSDENVLGVNYNGSVVETFYHPYKSIFSDDVKRFSLKNHNGNKHVYLFLKAIILKQKAKYQYGYKFNEGRMKQQKILLPITKDGEPDYKFMENYAKGIEVKQLTNYVSYLTQNLA